MAKQQADENRIEAEATAAAKEAYIREYAGWIAAGYDEDEANVFAMESSGDVYDAFLRKHGV